MLGRKLGLLGGALLHNTFATKAAQAKETQMKPIQKKIVTVVLTGGPCGGKTSSLQRLKDIFTNIGWNVYVVPEIPTIFILGGASYPGDHPSQKVKLLAFEKSIMQTQLQLEDAMRHVADANSNNSIIICDRGAMDIAAYMSQPLWKEVTAQCGQTDESLLGRYDIICHLVTAADGAPEHYTTANNAARIETIDQAIALDKKTQGCWKDHPCLAVVANKGSFDTKMKVASDFILTEALRLVS